MVSKKAMKKVKALDTKAAWNATQAMKGMWIKNKGKGKGKGGSNTQVGKGKGGNKPQKGKEAAFDTKKGKGKGGNDTKDGKGKGGNKPQKRNGKGIDTKKGTGKGCKDTKKKKVGPLSMKAATAKEQKKTALLIAQDTEDIPKDAIYCVSCKTYPSSDPADFVAGGSSGKRCCWCNRLNGRINTVMKNPGTPAKLVTGWKSMKGEVMSQFLLENNMKVHDSATLLEAIETAIKTIERRRISNAVEDHGDYKPKYKLDKEHPKPVVQNIIKNSPSFFDKTKGVMVYLKGSARPWYM